MGNLVGICKTMDVWIKVVFRQIPVELFICPNLGQKAVNLNTWNDYARFLYTSEIESREVWENRII